MAAYACHVALSDGMRTRSCATAAACFAGRPVEPVSLQCRPDHTPKDNPPCLRVSVAKFFVIFAFFVTFVSDREPLSYNPGTVPWEVR